MFGWLFRRPCGKGKPKGLTMTSDAPVFGASSSSGG